MAYKKISIRNKIRRLIMLVSGIVVLMTCFAFFIFEYYSFRESTLQKVSSYGKIISTNSTATLAFESKKDAEEILNALKAEPHIILAAIYDSKGNIFCIYPNNNSFLALPSKPQNSGYYFTNNTLEGFQPIMEDDKRLGTLYLKYDLKTMYSRFQLYGIIVLMILIFAFIISFILSRLLQKGISMPILNLAETAKVVYENKDYSVRATKLSEDEVGYLTDAFNLMLTQIQEQTKTLSEFNQNLEQIVKTRTSELEAANKELESFSYTVSHDLRAPVRSINSYMNIFMEEYGSKVDEEGKRLANTVIKNGAKMGSLIDDLLAFSQLGRKELIMSKISMNDLVLTIWEDLIKMEEGRDIEFNLKPLPEAYAEKSTMRQAWINLLTNALKYSKHREKTIIEVGSEKKDNEIVYYVKDNGAGFDMKYYNKLFGVFQRLHSPEDFEGTGVGLAIVDRVITKHHGKIWAESKVNEGATFYFSLPIVSV